MDGPVIEVGGGTLRGTTTRGVHAFKAIPYGAPTGGAHRFLPPAPAAPWSGVRDATALGPSCAQSSTGAPGPAGDGLRATMAAFGFVAQEVSTSEVCLRLNVWPPAPAPDGTVVDDGGARPVMFRIHGGGFTMGSGSWPSHDGTNLAARGDVVVVTVNHRLGVLGYLDLSSRFGSAYAASGNAGMLDLVLALEWVRDNIARFGGDPGTVTIFGESGGGYKVSTLLAMPSARGLFHRAIVQSGPGLTARAPEDAAKVAGMLLEELGDPDVDALRAMPVEQLLAAQGAIGARVGGTGAIAGFGPVRDGVMIPADPGDALADGSAADVPVIVGSTRHEATMFLAMAGTTAGTEMDDDALRAQASNYAGDRADAVIDAYRRAHPDASNLDLAVLIQSTGMMGRGSIELAERKLAGSTTPVWLYVLAWESPALDGFVKATHGMCIPLTMDNAALVPITDHPDAHALAAQMSAAWIAFARHGDPDHADLPKWEPYSLDQRATMVFDVPAHLDHDPFAAERLAFR